VTPTFNGNITNNGTIRNNPGGNELYMYTHSDIHNNGTWENRFTYLSSASAQKLSQSSGKKFSCEIGRSAANYGVGTGTITAASDLTFSNSVNLQSANYSWGIFNAAGYSITCDGAMRFIQTVFRNLKDFVMLNGAYLESVSFETNLTLKGTCNLGNSSIHFGGIVTVADTLQNSGYLGWVTGNFYNQIINNGVIRNNPAGNELWIDIDGSITGNGIFNNSRTYLYTKGIDRKISGENYNTSFYLKKDGDPASGTIKFTEKYENKGRTQIESGSHAEISSGCDFYNNSDLRVYGSLSNKGTVYGTRNFSTNSNQSFYNLSVSIASGEGLDSMLVVSYGDQVPATFGNGVKAWWRINTFPDNVHPQFGSATFYYEDALLNDNNESELKLFHSSDSGKTWVQLSTTANLTINANNNTASIADVPAYGDYILSSEPNPYSVKPIVIVSVIGRSQLRIGPPNRYTINYANNSLVPVDDFLIGLVGGTNTKILQAELTNADGTKQILPADSLNLEYEDSAATFYIAGLGAGEEGSFDIICTGMPLGKSLHSSTTLIEPFTLVAGAIIVYTGTKIIDYMGDKAVEKIEQWEVLSPAEKEAKRKIWGEQVKEEINKDKLRGVKQWAGRKVGQYILTKTMGVIGGTIDMMDAAKRNVIKVNKSLRKKVWDWLYRESGLYGVETTESGDFSPDVTGSSKKMQGVTSWDPNEKNGPEGYGAQKFITSAGRMHYQILFENKKEATDAAYQIVILDTLSNVFDPSTVEFGPTSHSGFTMTREGNILKWEVVGIELPPNVNPPEGEGYVTLSVKTVEGLESGTAISNQATITFDLNKPITTNLYNNTLDFTAPVTELDENIVVLEGDTLLINWSADDTESGSGINSTSLFCSIDDGAYMPAGISNRNTIRYPMISGSHKYSFYALSTDNVGNSEKSFTAVVSIDAVTSQNEDEFIPGQFKLMQNYPNPFNPSTTIEYWLPENGKVKLSLFNILGEKVVDLVDEFQRAGAYRKTLTVGGLSSGIYFYKLECGSFSNVKKLMLVK
ncbi:MAG: T9SS type A sorting domain-containing protein, partial [Melioribacteraceae bacterium]|nr:T9SS type A sorting domain-containing protein [Melioribacteraceae bacterium]